MVGGCYLFEVKIKKETASKLYELTKFSPFGMIAKAIDTKRTIRGGEAMAQGETLRFRKGDLLAIGLVLCLAAAVFLCFLPGSSEAAAYAEIYLDGQLVKTVPLSENQTFLIEGQYTSQITVADGAIAFTASDCPGQDCVHSGHIHTTGRSLVCLPNRVEVRVVSAVTDVDFVVG